MPDQTPAPGTQTQLQPLTNETITPLNGQPLGGRPGLPQPMAGFQLAINDRPDPFLEKLDPEHIHEILKNDEKESSRELTRHLVDRGSLLAVFFGVLLFVTLFAYMFSSNAQLVEKVIIGVLAFAAGIAAGAGGKAALQR